MILRDTSYFDFVGGLRPKLPSFFGWRVIEKYISGMNMTPKEEAFFEKHTHRRYRAGKMPRNFVLICGRRAGKSVECAYFTDWRALTFDGKLAPGETACNLVISPSYRNSSVMIDYCAALLQQLEEQSGIRLIARRRTWETLASIELFNETSIRSIPVNRTSGRSVSTLTCVMDEGAHFKVDGRFSDAESFERIRPGMATFAPHDVYAILTSPATREGLVFDLYEQYFGKEQNEVLIFQASSMDMNPTLDESWLEGERQARGESYWKREFLAEFVDAEVAAFSSASIESCVVGTRRELPYSLGCKYIGVIDPSGLNPNTQFGDEFVATVGHVNGSTVIQDAIRTWSANKDADRIVDPDTAIAESIELFRRYDVRKVISDRYAAAWVAKKITEAGFDFQYAPLSQSDLYLELQPVLNSRSIELLDNKLQTVQLKALEMKTSGSKTKIDHSRGRHDDRAAAVSLLAFSLQSEIGKPIPSLSEVIVCNERSSIIEELFGEKPMSGWDFEGLP
ncbi:hypothetical protein L0244_28410 [bacterium]|nr:hypothetical protein [bacterium]